MGKYLIVLLILFGFIGLNHALSFNLEFVLYPNNTALVENIGLSDQPPSSFFEFRPGLYSIGILSGNKIIWHNSTHIEFEIHGMGAENPIELANRTFFWRLPYFQSAEKISFENAGQLIFEIDLPKVLCVEDGSCSIYCGDKNDLDCEEEVGEPGKEEEEKEGFPSWPFIILGVLIVIGAIILFLSIKK